MERLSKEFDIKTKNNNYHLYDIVKKIIKPTSNSEIYKKILKKDRIKEDDEYYITEEQVLKLLSSKRTKACKTAVNILTVISKIEKTDGKYIFCDNEICVINDKKTGKIWFKVNNICDVLGYTALSRSKKIKEHVDDCNKTTLNDFLAPVKKTGVKKTEKCVKESLVDNKMVPYGSLSGNSKSVQMSTIFIDEPGLYSLILQSKKPIAKQFRKWVTSEVLPSIRKTGSYSLSDSEPDYESFVKDNLISSYENVNSIYLAYIGKYDGFYYYKFGKTNSIDRRNNEHKNNFDKFDLIRVFPTNNKDVVENKIKSDLRARNLIADKKINGKNQTELILETQDFNLSNIISLFEEIIKENPIITKETIELELEKVKLENDRILKEKELDLKYENEFKIQDLTFTYELSMKDKELEELKIRLEFKKLDMSSCKNTRTDILLQEWYLKRVNKHTGKILTLKKSYDDLIKYASDNRFSTDLPTKKEFKNIMCDFIGINIIKSSTIKGIKYSNFWKGYTVK